MAKVTGFSQKNKEIRYIEKAPKQERRFEEISLNEMARRTLNFLEKTPDKARNYECKFSMGPLGIPWHFPFCPPSDSAYDPVSLGDSDIRNMIAFPYMRELAGDPFVSETEKGLRKRIESYMNLDGVCTAGAQAFAGEPVEGEWVCLWGTSHTVIMYCDEFEKTGDAALLEKAEKAMDFWIGHANRKDDALYFECGNAPYKDGEWLAKGWAASHRRNYPYILTALLRIYAAANKQKYLDFAIAFGKGIVRGVQENMRELRVLDDGSFQGHFPVHTKMLAGMAMLSYFTKDAEFIKFTKRCYDYIVRMGTDFGWYPEFTPPEANISSEMCVTGDMLEASFYLIKCGFPEEYDRVERTYRNYMQSAQFRATDAFEKLYFSLHQSEDAGLVTENLRSLKEQLTGGFTAQLSINDYITNYSHLGKTGMNENGFQMMGCCQGAGMSGLYYIYKSLCEKSGDTVFINMSLNADTEYASIFSDYSTDEKLKVIPKTDGVFALRYPSWTVKEKVRVSVNGKEQKPQFSNGYIRVTARKDDVITLNYPLVHFVQGFRPQTKDTGEVYRIQWTGNRVDSMNPQGRCLPIY